MLISTSPPVAVSGSMWVNFTCKLVSKGLSLVFFKQFLNYRVIHIYYICHLIFLPSMKQIQKYLRNILILCGTIRGAYYTIINKRTSSLIIYLIIWTISWYISTFTRLLLANQSTFKCEAPFLTVLQEVQNKWKASFFFSKPSK